MYGTFPKEFLDALAPFVKGARVVDLGCGDMKRTALLAGLEPAALRAVDKEYPRGAIPEFTVPDVRFIKSYFVSASEAVQAFAPTVAHLAWPVNCPTPGLVRLLQGIPTVIYVGSNTDGSACGSVGLWRYLTTREVLLYRPDRRNTLIVYGPTVKARKLTIEEDAALNSYPIAYPFDPTPYP